MTGRQAYSRLETDEELLARICAVGGNRRYDETVEAAAERQRLERRIIWCEAS